ncbi:carbohydrate ABC transporter permease [Bacillus sp. FJAT-28004]|uniref:carbohydrate ABC transporter permease n=1 Tax=Bacillus sp. FJAT-28004 TaxID=1679165 RepID=UPI0006B58308|nr:carbohydrate ABC transporter permease [Bacillus sp. FJAT-28004]
MISRQRLGGSLFNMFNVTLLTLLMIATLYPLLYVLFASFSDPGSLYAHKGILFYPIEPTLAGYKLVFQNPNLAIGYRNTIYYVLLGTSISLLVTSMGAYVLSRKGLMWKQLMMILIVITMFFGGGLIPSFLLVKSLGFLNTVWAIVLPGAISAWNLIVMRTFFQSIPEELIESAKIDGANDFYIYFRIVLPLSMAIVAVMGLFHAVGEWNSWFSAVIYLRDREMYPLQLFLREILIQNRVDNLLITSSDIDAMQAKRIIKYAVIIVSTVPILLVYPFLQKYFVKGVLIGSLKE